VSKGHDIFATVHGHMTRVTGPAVIDRLWNPAVAVRYKDGKDDPTPALLRFDPFRAEIRRDGASLMAGLKLIFGGDPQAYARDSLARCPS
jgi:general stress protein 26